MNVSLLRERITVFNRNIKEEEDGEFTQTWVEKGDIWARITPLSFQEGSDDWGKNTLPMNRYKVRMRNGSVVKKTSRLKWGERILKVASPIYVDEHHRWIEFIVVEDKEE